MLGCCTTGHLLNFYKHAPIDANLMATTTTTTPGRAGPALQGKSLTASMMVLTDCQVPCLRNKPKQK